MPARPPATCGYCGHDASPGQQCGLRNGGPAPGSVYGDDTRKVRMCPYGLVDGRIAVIGREENGRPVLVLPTDPRAQTR